MTRADILTHYVQLAQQPGMWAYVQVRVRELDADTSGLTTGIYQEWRAQLLDAGFKPDPSEQGEWWVIESKVPPEPQPRKKTGGRP
jgi:hypothetical protein